MVDSIMADWYDRALSRVGQNILDLDNLTAFKILAVDSNYVFNQTHNFLSDVPVGARVALPVALSNITFAVSGEGRLDADDTTIIAPTVGKIIAGFVFYDDLGTEGISPLLFNATTGLGLPFNVQTTANIDISFATSGIARL